MKHTYSIHGMTCNGCRSKVESILNNLDHVIAANVNLETSEATIEASAPLDPKTIQAALPDKYTVQTEINNMFETTKTQEKSDLQQLFPLFLIFFYITTSDSCF